MISEDGLFRFFTELAKQDETSGSSDSKSTRRHRHRQTNLHRQRAIQESEAILRKAKIIA
jgi:hypothetical protein